MTKSGLGSCGTLAGALVLMILTPIGYAGTQSNIVFGSEYACNGGQTHFVIKACKKVYTFEQCDVQYLNSAAPGGLGALTQVRREMLESSLNGCMVGGTATGARVAQEGKPGQAQYLGTWYDVRILEHSDGKSKVRWGSGTEDWMDDSKVRSGREGTTPNDAAGGPRHLPDGRYACTGKIGAALVTFGFVDIAGTSYRGPSHSPSGSYAPFEVSADNSLTWSKGFGGFNLENGVQYQDARIVPGEPARFRVRYKTASGHSEALDCGRE
ncbi:MAG: hypothetical protein NVSMB62_17510 [Acidobacteriaceae bacterium]